MSALTRAQEVRFLPSGGDDSARLQSVINGLAAKGGTVRFLAGKRYKLSSQVTVSSLHPVHLLGEQSGLHWNVAGGMPCIELGAAIAGSMILYTAPVPASRAQHGGGHVQGLAFIDPTGSGGTPGARTVTAAIEANDFACSKVERCVFQWINGSAIKGEFVVMSHLSNNVIRYCGAVAKPAIYLPSTSATFPAQATKIEGNQVEVCHGAAYIDLGANSLSCKVLANGFEADTANAPSNQLFLSVAGVGGVVSGNTFNRNTGQQLAVAGSGNAVSSNVFAGGAFSATAVVVSGARNSVTGNVFRSARTGFEVDITGRSINFSSNNLYASGAVRVSGASCMVSGNVFDQMKATSAALGAGNEWWVSAESTATASIVSGNILNNNAGTVADVGGIRVKSTLPVVSGNVCNSFAGSGNGAIAIRTETNNPIVVGNGESNCTTFISASTPGAGVYRGNLAASSTAAIPLTGSAVWDPASVAAGARVSTTVAVTGAVAGDYAAASFSLPLSGLVLCAEVSGANTVTVTLVNNTGAAVDLASGTIRCRVEHQ